MKIGFIFKKKSKISKKLLCFYGNYLNKAGGIYPILEKCSEKINTSLVYNTGHPTML
jgi:hypothetical protein